MWQTILDSLYSVRDALSMIESPLLQALVRVALVFAGTWVSAVAVRWGYSALRRRL